MNKAVALANFRDANEVLRTRTTYWMDCGTLLGAIRENDFLEHDADVDFGVWGTENHKRIAAAMFRRGFSKWAFFGTPDYGYEQSFKRDGVKVDFFYFYPKREELWQGSWLDGHLIESVFDRELVLPPVRMLFHGIETYGPHHPDLMLEARYGDWDREVKVWDWARDPVCITPETRPS